MQVIFIHGPAAAGKHTIGRLLSERTGLPLFHNHLTVDLAMTLFEFGTVEFNRLSAAVWRAAFSQSAAARKSFIFTFHPEATVDPSLIPELAEYVSAVGGRGHFIELTCTRGTVLERIANASRTAFGKLTDPDLYVQIDNAGGFRFPPLPEPLLIIDTTTVAVDDAAKLIDEALLRVSDYGDSDQFTSCELIRSKPESSAWRTASCPRIRSVGKLQESEVIPPETVLRDEECVLDACIRSNRESHCRADGRCVRCRQ